MKRIALILSLLIATQAMADNSSLNLQLPSPSSNYASDKFRAGDLDCSNAIGGGTNLEFGVTGIVNGYQSPFDSGPDNSSKDIGLFARIVIPLDGPKERINCNTLYQLELQKKRLEVLKLQQELDQLRQLQQGADVTNFQN